MRTTRILAVLGVAVVLAAAGAYADSEWLKGSTEEKLKTLADLQPGLGTVMIEYGNRYTNAYYAAKGGNWDLAAYQIKEAREIQEVGENTRPARAQALKGFEKNYLDPLDEVIKAKDFKKFDKAFRDGIQGCNTCHAGQGFPYIKYELPKAPASPLAMKH
ncbi:MAG TPA: hypothetical protein VEU07_03240 [Candidatus Acidoferrum sp.]|nr:hypothetical protein [Candidatus Acidoferrum sp.]